MEAVVVGTVLDGEEDDEKEHLSLFENRIFINAFYAFLDYTRLNENNDIVDVTILKLARYRLEVATVLICLEQRKNRGRQMRKVYAKHLRSDVIKAVNLIICLDVT